MMAWILRKLARLYEFRQRHAKAERLSKIALKIDERKLSGREP